MKYQNRNFAGYCVTTLLVRVFESRASEKIQVSTKDELNSGFSGK